MGLLTSNPDLYQAILNAPDIEILQCADRGYFVLATPEQADKLVNQFNQEQ